MSQSDHTQRAATFSDVLACEAQLIRARRRVCPQGKSDAATSAKPKAPPPLLEGLALSGGGIRSATFALGLLQELSRLGVLPRFDYLSTVSGGGYTGAWWSAWQSRNAKLEPFPQEQIEPQRWADYASSTEHCDGSYSAQHRDPIHHLRLFANYLTPRKGALSGDTWRAVMIVIRNLLFTWSVLLPILIALVLCGQLFFALQVDAASLFFQDGGSWPYVQKRLSIALQPLLVLSAWLVTLSLLWQLYSVGRWLTSLLGTTSVLVMAYFLAGALAGDSAPVWRGAWGWLACGGSALALIGCVVPLMNGASRDLRKREVMRNRIVRLQTGCTIAWVATALTLGIAGFSHDILAFFLTPEPGHPAYDFVRQAGGVGAVLLTVGSTLFTALKGAPSANSDPGEDQAPSAPSQLVFAIAPALVVLALGMGIAASAILLVRRLAPHGLSVLESPTWWGVGTLLFFAGYETIRSDLNHSWPKRAAIVLIPCLLAAITMGWLSLGVPLPLGFAVASSAAAVIALLGRFFGQRVIRKRFPHSAGWVVASVALLGGGVAWVLCADGVCGSDAGRFVALAIACCAFSLCEGIWLDAQPQQWRAASLVAVAFIGGLVLGIPHLMSAQTLASVAPAVAPLSELDSASIVSCMIVITFSMTVGLGWVADPNQLSLHAFYRARLVRAYLGASNKERSWHEISDSEEQDDLCLHTLDTCSKGGPYHLINTTLNLVGGRDLATSQRSADSFLLSPEFCGSARTGFRPTRTYMRGALSLGTAVAISGAAVSPNMGSKTPSAALSMLLTFFNLRLGYWAPTPNQGRWATAQARLWPYYLLRESLSQTTTLTSYCYLTDGGHFDNTGIHALVARGCRVIVLADAGADPRPCFEDVGNVIRRCRIDFGAEINLALTSFDHSEQRKAGSHVVFGSITYSAEHAERLGWRDADVESKRKGVVVWIKPVLTGRESVDVRQYGLENSAFPQQSTSDQWYDEAQFESYRRLGMDSARAAFGSERFEKQVKQLAD